MKLPTSSDYPLILHGDCVEQMRLLPEASVHAVVTDPPYGLEFMGKEWDAPWKQSGTVLDDPASVGGFQDGSGGDPFSRARVRFGVGEGFQQWCHTWLVECFRVLKPGGHALIFGGTRTFHRMAVAVEDAGFEIRDSIAWLYGSGFPKSLNVSKALDKLDAADERLARAYRFTAWMRQHVTAAQIDAATDTNMGGHYVTAASQPAVATAELFDKLRPLLPDVPAWVEQLVAERTVESEDYKRREKIGVKRGALSGWSMDGGSQFIDRDITTPATDAAKRWDGWGTALKPAFEPVVVARKPLTGTVAANVLEHGTGALNVDGCRIGSDEDTRWNARGGDNGLGGTGTFQIRERRAEDMPETSGRWPANVILDEHTAAIVDEQSGVSTSGAAGLKGSSGFADGYSGEYSVPYGDTGGASRFFYVAKAPSEERPTGNGTAHPTVKPLDLMRWLVRLVTPPGGIVLEPFAGSGTTVEACIREDVRCIAIEREADYLPLINERINRNNLSLFAGGEV